MQQKLSDMAEIWVFLIFCIFAGNMTASMELGEISVYSLLVGTFAFGILMRFIIPLDPAFLFRKLTKRRCEYNHWALLIVSLITYAIYIISVAYLFNPKLGGTFRLGVPDIWAIHLWTRIINYGKEKRCPQEDDVHAQNADNDITIKVINTLKISADTSTPYKYLEQGDDIECQELIDGSWVTTGFYTKSTKSIRPVKITKDTMILLSNLYWYYRKIEK